MWLTTIAKLLSNWIKPKTPSVKLPEVNGSVFRAEPLLTCPPAFLSLASVIPAIFYVPV